MSRVWTSDEVVALAPDPASAKAGEGLASPGKWALLGRNDAALWGLCKGSGAEPYQVRIDPGEPAYRCSCPSRKIPCKHVIGLFLIHARQSAALTVSAEAPAWVGAWLEKRAEKKQPGEKAASGSGKAASGKASGAPADPKQKAEREAQRRANIQQGLDELDRRLADVIHGGLASALDRSYQFWDESARRLVDAQAPGIARLARELAGVTGKDPHWAETLLAKSGRLRWIIEAWRRIEALAPAEQADLRALAGWPVPKEEVLAGETLSDRWRVMAVALEEDDQTRIRTQRVWLWGAQSRRAALVLEFAHKTQPLAWMLPPGAGFDAEIAFYPGAAAHRALIKTRSEVSETSIPVSGYASFAEALEAYAAALEKSPWIDSFPMLLEGIVPWRDRDAWRWIDAEGATVPAVVPDRLGWKWLAESGGRPIQVFGEWQGECFVPLPAEMNCDRPASAKIEAAAPMLAELAHGAMLGASRQKAAIPAAAGEFRSVLESIASANEPEGGVLLMAGAIDGYLRMGRVPSPYRGEAPGLAPEEALSPAPAQASSLLAGMLDGRHEILIAEWLALAADHRRLAPPALLPALLTRGERETDLRRPIAAAGGERARWLARFRPEWRWAARQTIAKDGPDERLWEEGDRQDRIAYLRALRALDPARARETLAACFAKESSLDRLAFIAALSEGLSNDDEALLNRALADKSTGVREVAAQFLSALPRSAFAARMRERLGRCVRIERKLLRKKLEIEPLEELDQAAIDDRLAKKGPARLNFGEKGWHLAQLVALTPLDFWASIAQDLKPSDLLALIEKTDWWKEVSWGLLCAAARQRSADWAEALLLHEKIELDEEEEVLFERLTSTERTRVAAELMKKGKKLEKQGIAFLKRCPGPWTPELSRLALSAMRRIAAKAQVHDWSQAESFCAFAAAIDRDLLPEALKGWDAEAGAFKYLTSKPEHFISILQTRKSMIEEFKHGQE